MIQTPSFLTVNKGFFESLRLPLAKGAPHPSSCLCPSQKGEDVTAPPVALNRFALGLADHQSIDMHERC